MREGNEAERHGSRLPLTTIVSPFPILNSHQHKTFKKNLLPAFTIIVFNTQKPGIISFFSQVKRVKSEK